MTDRDSIAKHIFEEVRDQPYRLSLFAGDLAPNCALKGTQLIERLGSLGFGVRGRVADFLWENTPLPKEIVSLYPTDLEVTHFFVEILIDDDWRQLDASWDSGLEKCGFPIATWDGINSPGIKLERIYGFEEQASYLKLCANRAYAEKYFTKAADFLREANKWFEKIRG
jgi:hypothetical protein